MTLKRKKDKAKPEPEETPVDTAQDEKRADAQEAHGVTEEAAKAEPTPEEWHDRYLRLVAEFDNFRKRSAREFGDLIRNAERELIGELTEVLDNLDRALNQDQNGESIDELAKGINLIRDQLWTAMGKRGLERMEALGLPFDPEAHDAMMRMPSDEHNEGCVAQEISPGYRLGDRVLRHAKVIVSQGKQPEEAPASDDAAEES